MRPVQARGLLGRKAERRLRFRKVAGNFRSGLTTLTQEGLYRSPIWPK